LNDENNIIKFCVQGRDSTIQMDDDLKTPLLLSQTKTD